ncbi:hypothetical protein HO173_013401 [Letharia columbiana]|nr:uncharacterized protein HO173_013401 [Letharia columbiana]KAF6222493.1 hypothetical protein HO173_013401 [Letharia columbiana]
MSFGVGVGDILAVSKLARSVWSQVRDSSDQFNAIRNEVAGLHLVLEDVAQNSSRCRLSGKQKSDLSS